MEKVNIFLKELYLLKKKYDDISDAQERFNIFSVLHKENDERRLHSRFISALLSPCGSHGQKNLFLNAFLRKTSKDTICFENAEVFPKEDDKSENSHIDILIIDKRSKHAVIIENKIYAGDSNNPDGGQLERYYAYVKNVERVPKDNIYVFYLTLDGHDPTPESFGKSAPELKEKCLCISYGEYILPWLEECVSMVVSRPFLRESILQYIRLLKKMINDISLEQRLELCDAIGRTEDNLMSAKLLIDNFRHVKWHTVRDFWNELSQELGNSGYKVFETPSNEDITYITHNDCYKKGYKNRYRNLYLSFEPLKGLTLHIGSEYSRKLFFGCVKKNRKTSVDYQNKIVKLCAEKNDYYENDLDFLFTKDFDFPNGKEVLFYDFSREGTFRLIDKKHRKNIIGEIVSQIKNFVDEINKIR